MLASVGLAILHGCVAAAFIEGLLRAWRVDAPDQRLALRLVALLAPFALPALLTTALPARQTADFAVYWAVFAGASWDPLRVAGLGLSSLATLALAGVGVALFLRDAAPFVADRISPPRERVLPRPAPAYARLDRCMAELAPASSARHAAPAIRVLAESGAVLFCSGISRATITVSTGTLDRLDDDALAAALAHELEHARRRDPAWGWALLAVRTLQVFNPATQLIARQIVQEIEARTDRHVASLGMAPAMARAIDRLAHVRDARTDLADGTSLAPAVARLAARAAERATSARNERLLEDLAPDPPGLGPFRVALAAVGLTALLAFVI